MTAASAPADLPALEAETPRCDLDRAEVLELEVIELRTAHTLHADRLTKLFSQPQRRASVREDVQVGLVRAAEGNVVTGHVTKLGHASAELKAPEDRAVRFEGMDLLALESEVLCPLANVRADIDERFIMLDELCGPPD